MSAAGSKTCGHEAGCTCPERDDINCIVTPYFSPQTPKTLAERLINTYNLGRVCIQAVRILDSISSVELYPCVIVHCARKWFMELYD